MNLPKDINLKFTLFQYLGKNKKFNDHLIGELHLNPTLMGVFFAQVPKFF
jgi:hypothetical protein